MALPWDDPSWLAEISAWTSAHTQLTAPLEVLHRRAWSAMLRGRTAGGDLYVKATAPSSRHEVELTAALAGWAPDVTVELVATEPERGWLLMVDAGPPLRAQLTGDSDTDPDLAMIERLYRRYARLQRDLAPRAGDVLSMGTPDRRLRRFPALAADVGADPQLVERLVAAVASCPLPDTLVHEEIHDANLVVRSAPTGPDELVIIDWADSCVGHPFFGVVVGLRSLSDRLDLEPGAPVLQGLVDAYLQEWADLAPLADLRAAFAPAYRLGMLNRAISWGSWDSGLDDAGRAEHQQYVEAWLAEFDAAHDPLPGT